MSTALIIEPADEHLKVVKNCIAEINPSIEVMSFASLNEFYQWFKDLTRKIDLEAGRVKATEEDLKLNSFKVPEEIDLMIADFEVLKHVKMSLLEKTQKYFVSKNLVDAENPTRFVVLAYENHDFDIEDYFSPIISCVLFKPFDAFILKQSIENALKGYVLLSSDTYTQQVQSDVDIVKRVDLVRLTELGFRTKSTREISQGNLAKYYGQIFKGQKIDFLYAKNQLCEKVEDDSKPYECSFSFFGMEMEQLRTVRQSIRKSEKKESMPFSKGKTPAKLVNAFVFSVEENLFHNIKSLLKEKFNYIEAFHIKNLSQVLATLGSTNTQELGQSPFFHIFSNTEELYRFVFDDKGQNLLKIVDSTGQNVSFLDFHLDKSTVKVIDFLKGFAPSDQKKWQALLQLKKIDKEQFLEIKNTEDQLTILKLRSVKEEIDQEEGSVTVVEVKELSDEVLKDYYSQNSFSNKKADAIFVDEFYFTDSKVNTIHNLKKIIGTEDCKIFGISKYAITHYSEWNWAQHFFDYFTLPLDAFYFTRKLKQAYGDWDNKEALGRDAVKVEDHIYAAISVLAEEVSETFITIQYHRQIPFGELREFVFHQDGVENVPILGYCNYGEKLEGDEYRLQFVFFGLRDKQRKSIRKWMKAEYLKQKQSS